MSRNKRTRTVILAISLLGAVALLSNLLTGCDSIESIQYGDRGVRGAVLPIPATGDAQASDLLITNWSSSGSSGTFYVTYTAEADGARNVLWERELEEFDGWYYPHAIYDESRIYYVAGARLLALDREDGSTAWEAPLSDLVWSSCRHCLQKVRGYAVLLTTDYVLQGVDVRSGEVAWSVRLNHVSTAHDGFSVVDDQIVLVDQIGPDSYEWAVHLFNPLDGTLIRHVSPSCLEAGAQPSWRSDEVFIEQGTARGSRAIFLYSCWSDPYVQSQDLASGEMVWQEPVPWWVGASVESFMLGRDTLYLDMHDGLFAVALTDGQTTGLGEIDPDHTLTLLDEYDGVVIAKARRTRGSVRHELWGLDAAGERLWRYELQADTLMGVDSGSEDWTYRLTSAGMTLIQLLDDDPDRVSVVTLDPRTGRVVHQSDITVDPASLSGVAWGSHTGYLTVWGDVYAVDPATSSITPEWP